MQETQVQEKGGVIPGIGFNESLTRWCFKQSVGGVSDPFTIPNGYVVVNIAEAKDAGVKSFADVRESLQPLVLRKKKLEKARTIAAEYRQNLAEGDSLRRVSTINPSIPVQETGTFTLGGIVPGVGRDPVFIGTVSGLKPAQISQAFLGQRGAFLVQLLSRSAFDSVAYNAQREMLHSRLLQDKRSRFASDWLEKLKENANIEDNREMFFR
jgi:hypothetical protein